LIILAFTLFALLLSFPRTLLADTTEEDPLGIEPDDYEIRGESPHIVPPEDVENGIIQLEIDLAYILYKDSTASEHYIPFILRIDTGKNTEFRISSGFVEYQPPYFGINDITLGFKWQFREENPSMGLVTGAQLPTGSDHFTDKGIEPFFLVATDYKFNEKWHLLAIGSWISKIDSGTTVYNQGIWGAEVGYELSSDKYISISAGLKYPNKNDGVGLTTVALNYNRTIRPDLQLTFHLIRGLSSIDQAWSIIIGINQHL